MPSLGHSFLILCKLVSRNCVLVGLIEAVTNVVTDVVKHKHVVAAGLTGVNSVCKLLVVVLVDNLSRVGGLIVKECGALLELSGGCRDSNDTSNVMYKGEVLLRIFSGACLVKRNGSNTEAAADIVPDMRYPQESLLR